VRIILHIDFDSFFASVEQQYKTYLRGKPVGVTATNGRTCIIASSREAKQLGIKTGDRTWESLPKCPDLILVSADFNKYYEISKKFLNIAKDFSPLVELFSIDEAFIDITETEHLFGGVKNVIQKIKDRVKNEIGEYITVSIGISHNKLLAKLASGLAKPARLASESVAGRPNGVFEINNKNIEEVLRNAKLTDFCGIGERIEKRLNMLGVYTALDLQETQENLLIEEFGKVEAHFLKNLSQGFDDSPLVSYAQEPEVKSIGRNYCLPKNEYNKKVVLQNIYELCEEIAIRLRALNKLGRTVSLFLGGFEDVGRRKTISEFMDGGAQIFEICQSILNEDQYFFKNNRYYTRQINISVSSLEDSAKITISLFEQTKKNKVVSTIDRINEKFGDHTIRNGFLLYSDKLTTMPNGYMADNFERTRLALEVAILDQK